MQEAEFVVDEGAGTPSEVSKAEQLKFLPALEVTDDMEQGQKDFAQAYNLMRETLLKYKLMKAK